MQLNRPLLRSSPEHDDQHVHHERVVSEVSLGLQDEAKCHHVDGCLHQVDHDEDNGGQRLAPGKGRRRRRRRRRMMRERGRWGHDKILVGRYMYIGRKKGCMYFYLKACNLQGQPDTMS